MRTACFSLLPKYSVKKILPKDLEALSRKYPPSYSNKITQLLRIKIAGVILKIRQEAIRSLNGRPPLPRNNLQPAIRPLHALGGEAQDAAHPSLRRPFQYFYEFDLPGI
jgi:hypothetical protein